MKLRSIWVPVLMAICCLPGLTAWGKNQSTPGFKAVPVTIRVNNAVLKGNHYVKKNGRRNQGTPILFVHGITLNLHEFDDMIRERMEAGDDVYAFNFRGHGNGRERSYVTDYQDGDYRFDRMVDEDFPAMINMIFKARNEPISVIGHSMGGMVSLASIGLGHVAGKIRSEVAIAAPAQVLGRINPENRFWRDYVSGLLNAGSGDAPINILAPLEAARFVNILNPFYPALEHLFMEYVAGPSLEGIALESNFDEGFENWADKAVSREVPTDIFRSFEDFGRPGRGYKYTGLKVHVPVLHVVAGHEDQLAKGAHIIRNARSQVSDPGHWLVDIDGASHVDLVSRKVSLLYSELVNHFIIDPYSLGPPNVTRFHFKVGAKNKAACDRMLTLF
jgi:pimeloyl-ACP methyl ester carboxylesterase